MVSTTLALVEIYLTIGGLVSLIGWVAGVPRLTNWDGASVPIPPNACIAVLGAAAALALLSVGSRRAAAWLGVGIALIGGTGLLASERAGEDSPGNMVPAAAAVWTLVGIGFVLASRPKPSTARRYAPALALVTASISALDLVGYLYGASIDYGISRSTGISLQAASFMLFVSLGLMLSVREHGIVRLLDDPGPAGILVRRVLPAILFVPVLVGFLRLLGERARLYDTAFGTSLRTLVEIILFLLLLWWVAVAVRRQAERRENADRSSRENQRQLEAELADTRLLQSISTELVVQEDSASFYESIVDAAVRIMRSDFGSIQVFHPERGKGELKLLAHQGFSEETAARWTWIHRESESTCAEAMRSGKRVVIPDLDRCDFMAGTQGAATYRQLGIHAMQSTPLVSRTGVMLGMISTHWSKPHEPSERSQRLFDILARQAADWIERARSRKQKEELLEKERAARSDAERAARIKDEFLATLSHELRTPLNAVIGWSQILKRDLSNHERARAAVEIIERNGRQQARLITDLLDISRIVSGNMRLDVQVVDLAAVIEAAIDSVLPAAAAKGVRILRLTAPISQPVNGDPARIQQMVWNLLSNAVKFTPRGGRINVVLERAGSSAAIRVIDSGEGIAREFLPQVFERFTQGDASTSRLHSGLGLGLAIVKQFAELHGGAVRASSEGPGKGATFVIELPLAALPEKEHEVAPAPSRPFSATPTPNAPVLLRGIRVLLVDDEPDALTMVQKLLEENQANVGTAPSSQAALDLLRRERFDVIVSDIGMPGRDGYDLISEVRTRGIRTPAVALTAFVRAEDRTRTLASGYQAHIAKPVDTAELLAAVARWGGQLISIPDPA